ncbi:DUF485 domain-containing protein [Streptomyces apocyni]|uniref:DUF485 domain-containing protein n=1 Tax=Streptomyces apocyni TaxID=2654677 RepID=UPI0012EA5CBC|nr:DUF485 domain-containing protein [Streptomyces apocyni]
MSYGPDPFPPPPAQPAGLFTPQGPGYRPQAYGSPAAAAPTPVGPPPGLPRLRSSYRRLRRVMTLAALGYFVVFLLLTGYAPGLMETELVGGFTFGLVMGLLQFPVTFAAIIGYERSAVRTVDPLARDIRRAVEERGARGGAR